MMSRARVLALFALVCVLAVAALSCGGGAQNESIAHAESATWSTSLLGGPADIMFRVNVGGLLADPRYGPPLAHGITEFGHASEDYPVMGIDDPQFYTRTTMDLYATFGPTIEDTHNLRVVAVIRGAPNFDPRAFRTRHGETNLSPNVRTFPSGVSEFLSGAHAKKFVLYVMPDHTTWIITDDLTAQRAGPYFWSNGAAPPAAPDDGSLAMVFLGQRVIGLLYVALSREDKSAEGIVGMQTAVLSLRPSREATVLGQYDFDSAEHASALAKMFDPNVACTTKPCREIREGMATLPTTAAQSGVGVKTTTTLPEKVLQKMVGN